MKVTEKISKLKSPLFRYELRRRIAAVWFPNRCPFCDKIISGRAYCCEPCRRHLPFIYGKIEPPEHVSKMLACCSYSGRARRAVLSLKYGGLVYPADAFGELMSEKLRGAGAADLLVPVPSGFLSIKKRGFSTAKLICGRISMRLGIPMSEAVAAVDDKVEQKTLSRKGRLENARKCFYLAKNADVKNKHVILVDDVSTTGSTLSVIAELLLAAGAADVKALVFAKTLCCTHSDKGVLRVKNLKSLSYKSRP